MNASQQPAPTARAPRFNDLGLRAASGLALITVALATVRAGGVVFGLVWLLVALAVCWEWARLVGGAAVPIRLALGCFALVATAALNPAAALLSVGSAAALAAAVAGDDSRMWAAGGVLYPGLFLVALLALRGSVPDGARAILWLFATVWSTDVFAYFGGRLIGGRKIWPRISPSKTWSGTLIGVLAGGGIGTVVGSLVLPSRAAVVTFFVLTLATAFVSQLGDAFESAVKRHFGVKDTSQLIPGHGGVMDRLDGFIAAAVFAFLVGWTRHPASAALGLFH